MEDNISYNCNAVSPEETTGVLTIHYRLQRLGRVPRLDKFEVI